MCCKGKGVVNAATPASALSSTQHKTARVADAMQRLVVQGTVQPVGGKGTTQHWTTGLAVVVSGGLGMPDVHGRPAARDIRAAGNCDHDHVRVVTASDVHFSRDDDAYLRPCAGHAAHSRPASPPTSVGQQPGPMPRWAGFARRRQRRFGGLPTVSLLSLYFPIRTTPKSAPFCYEVIILSQTMCATTPL
jgi:hypothetical protein